jgi:hypothetical protein
MKYKMLHKIRMKISNLGDYINNNPCSKYTESIYYFLCALFFNYKIK